MAEIVPVLEQATQEFADATAAPPFLFDSVRGGAQDRRLRAGRRRPRAAVDVVDMVIAGGPSGESPLGFIARPGRPAYCPSCCSRTAPAGCSATRTPTTAWSASSRSGPARRPCSPTTPSRRRRSTRPRSRRSTRPRVDRRPWRRTGARPGPHRGLRGLRRRQHDRRAHPDGQAARRPADRGPVAVLPGHRRQLRHRLLPAVRDGYWLRRDAMQWFWDQYTTDPASAAEITGSPLRATWTTWPACRRRWSSWRSRRAPGRGRGLRRQAARRRRPVTSVRFQGIIHDFVMVNSLRDTHAARPPPRWAADFLRAALHGRVSASHRRACAWRVRRRLELRRVIPHCLPPARRCWCLRSRTAALWRTRPTSPR